VNGAADDPVVGSALGGKALAASSRRPLGDRRMRTATRSNLAATASVGFCSPPPATDACAATAAPLSLLVDARSELLLLRAGVAETRILTDDTRRRDPAREIGSPGERYARSA
jgi:hypothetical protein